MKLKFPKDLISIADLTEDTIFDLFGKAKIISKRKSPPKINRKRFWGFLFLEPSTRTRLSFERAAFEVGFSFSLFEGTKSSSLEKGETFEDMIDVFIANGIHHFVIRTPQTGGLDFFRNLEDAHVINGGDGNGEHPTQALLDALTLHHFLGKKKSLKGISLLIQGDVLHSRVARSWALLGPRLGIDLKFSSPAALRPQGWGANIPWSENPREFQKSSQFVMAIRVQKERFEKLDQADLAFSEIEKKFCLVPKDLGQNQFVMAPGPVNWGVELDAQWREDPRSLVLEQVRWGRFLRAAVMSSF